MDVIEEIEEKIRLLDERLTLVECRWEPKLIVFGVFYSDASTWNQDVLYGVYSTQENAQAKIDRSITPETPVEGWSIEELTLDGG